MALALSSLSDYRKGIPLAVTVSTSVRLTFAGHIIEAGTVSCLLVHS
jgi:hypothetical protein